MRRFLTVLVTLAAVSGWMSPAAQEAELLSPEEAFGLQIEALSRSELKLQWAIAPGYYLYRQRFEFKVLNDRVSVKETRIPKGELKQDPFLGESEIYKKQLAISLILNSPPENLSEFELEVTSQGCNEPVGVCYPPMKQTKLVSLPPEMTLTQTAGSLFNSANGSGNLLQDLFTAGGGNQPFLDPDEAYRLSVSALDSDHLIVQARIAEGYYLYQDKFEFAVQSGEFKLQPYEMPPAVEKTDQYFGDSQVYYEGLELVIPLDNPGRGLPQTLGLRMTYQGCAENGICYPPIIKNVAVDFPAAKSVITALDRAPAAGSSLPVAEALGVGEVDSASFLALLIGAFGAGVLLTFTPCVLPMIPILSSIIVGQKQVTRARGGLLSLVYVAGTSITYVFAGAVAGATGEQLQAYFQYPWVLITFSSLFVLMAMSMFGLYEIQMPAWIQSRLHSKTQSISGGNILMVLLLGMLSALIVGACVSPLLIGVLGVAISQADPWLGAGIMFAMAWGMGLFLIAIGFGAGYFLPKAGFWMERVKQVFGVMLLAVAVYLLGLIPDVPVLLLWAALLIVLAVYLGATQSLPENASGWRYLWKGVGTCLLIWGLLALVGGLLGNRDLLRPIEPAGLLSADSSASSPEREEERHLFTRLKTWESLQAGFQRAGEQNKLVLVDYYADWCVECVRMEKTTFADAQVVKKLRQNFVLLQVDVTDPRHRQSSEIKKSHAVFGPPATLFFLADGSELRAFRFYGYKDAAEFNEVMNAVLEGGI